MEAMKEVEKKLWLEHHNHLCEKLLEVLREKCTGCQTDEPNQLGHEDEPNQLQHSSTY